MSFLHHLNKKDIFFILPGHAYQFQVILIVSDHTSNLIFKIFIC